MAVYRDGRLEVRPYWGPDFQAEEHARPADDAQELREVLTSAVEMRLQSDVPLGAFLSGGIDSSIIVGLMQKLNAPAGEDVFHRLSRRGVRRDALRRDRRETFGTLHQSSASSRTPSACSPSWYGTTTSRLPIARPCRLGISPR